MNQRFLTIVALTLLAAGCKTRNESSDIVITAIVPPTATAGTGTPPSLSCAFDSGATEFTPALPYNPVENSGTVAAIVQNNLVPATTNSVLRTDTTTFLPHQAVVTYEYIPASAGTPPGQQVIPTSGVTIPGGGKGTVGMQLLKGLNISVADGTYIRTTLHLEGKLLDGSIVHTAEREYLFQACSKAGCGLGGPWAVAVGAATASCL